MGKTVNIGGRIHNPEVGNVVTGANEILDDTKGKKQNVINSEVDTALAGLGSGKQDKLTFDQTPTESSTNPVTSGGVYAADQVLQQAIESILLLIPSAASALNQLADKSFVNSSIATASATFRGTYNLVSDLHLSVSASHQDIATALASVVATADNNDYCFVQIPTSDTSSDIRVTERYKFNGTAWAYEYDLNNSGFTAQQWAAINSTITSALVGKLSALPTADELATLLAGKQPTLTFDDVPVSGSNNPVKSGGLYQLFTAIDAKFPSDASANNKLVAENRLAAYVGAIVGALDATYDLTSTDGHVTLKITQTDGLIASVQVLTSDIASAAQVSQNTSDIATLQDLYNALQQSAPEIIQPTDTWPVANPSDTVIYRVIDRVNTPPEYYSDYMYNGTTMVLMATYNNAIDPRPKKGSANLVTSGGVFDNMGALDVSKLNASGGTLATYADLSAALAAIPSDYQDGGMSIKFVSSVDNKYVQYRLMTNTWSTNVTDWQGIDNKVIPGSNNLVDGGGIYSCINEKAGSDTVINKKLPNSGLMYNGGTGKVVSANENYDGCVFLLEKGTTYNTNSSNSVISQKLFNQYPQVGDEPTGDFTSPYTPNTDMYLLVTVALSVTTDVTLNSLPHGLVEKINNIEEQIGAEGTKVYPASCGLIFNGTSVVGTTGSRFNGVLIQLSKYATYSLADGNVTSCRIFESKPTIGDIGTGSILPYTALSDGMYMLLTVDTNVNETISINTTPTGLYGRTIPIDDLDSQIPDRALSAKQGFVLNGKIITIDERVGHGETTTTKDADSGLIYNGGTGRVSAANERFNGAIFFLKGGVTYSVQGSYSTGVVNATIYSSYPEVDMECVELNPSYPFNAINDCYLLATVELSRTESVTLISSSTGIIKDVAQVAQLSLSGKKIVCFGDSLTEFTDIYGMRYSDYIEKLYGANVINCGIGGTQFRQRRTPVLNPTSTIEGYAGLDVISMVRAACGVQFDSTHSYADVVENAAEYIKVQASDDNTAIVARMLAIDWSQIDAVIVFAGTNDWNNAVGFWGASGSTDVNLTLGAINEIIRLILSTYKHIKLYWITPIVRWLSYSGGTGDISNFSDNLVKSGGGESANLRQFSEMIRNEVYINHIPVCDMYNTLGINMSNFSQYFTDNDGTHPTKGFEMIAEKIASFVIANKTM